MQSTEFINSEYFLFPLVVQHYQQPVMRLGNLKLSKNVDRDDGFIKLFV